MEPPPEGTGACPWCAASLGPGARKCPRCGATYLHRPPEYRPGFRGRSFSWPAALFRGFWYVYKGMWRKGLVLLTIDVLETLLVGALVPVIPEVLVAVWVGFMAHPDYLRYYNTRRSFWW